FQKLRNSPVWVESQALKADWVGQVSQDAAVEVALAARKFTDLLLLRLKHVPRELDLRPNGPQACYARAAYLSWGHLLRRVACDLLDVEPNELDVNIRPMRSENGGFYEVFLMDTLENGAGYCSYLANAHHVNAALVAALVPHGKHYQRLLRHADGCDSACYDCLRDYGNADMHALLDWRLALDLAHLASGVSLDTAAITLDTPHWAGVAEAAAKSLAGGIRDGSVKRLETVWAVQSGHRVAAGITHPLWSVIHSLIQLV